MKTIIVVPTLDFCKSVYCKIENMRSSTEYQLFDKKYLSTPNIELFGCNLV